MSRSAKHVVVALLLLGALTASAWWLVTPARTPRTPGVILNELKKTVPPTFVPAMARDANYMWNYQREARQTIAIRCAAHPRALQARAG